MFVKGPRGTVGTPITHSKTIAQVLGPLAEEANQDKRERFWCLMLDVRNRIIMDPWVVAIGSLNACIVHPREAFREAVKASAHRVVFAHNHPSGETTPSDEDKELTLRMSAAGDVLGIVVLDHVILDGKRGHYSFADSGTLRVRVPQTLPGIMVMFGKIEESV